MAVPDPLLEIAKGLQTLKSAKDDYDQYARAASDALEGKSTSPTDERYRASLERLQRLAGACDRLAKEDFYSPEEERYRVSTAKLADPTTRTAEQIRYLDVLTEMGARHEEGTELLDRLDGIQRRASAHGRVLQEIAGKLEGMLQSPALPTDLSKKTWFQIWETWRFINEKAVGALHDVEASAQRAACNLREELHEIEQDRSNLQSAGKWFVSDLSRQLRDAGDRAAAPADAQGGYEVDTDADGEPDTSDRSFRWRADAGADEPDFTPVEGATGAARAGSQDRFTVDTDGDGRPDSSDRSFRWDAGAGVDEPTFTPIGRATAPSTSGGPCDFAVDTDGDGEPDSSDRSYPWTGDASADEPAFTSRTPAAPAPGTRQPPSPDDSGAPAGDGRDDEEGAADDALEDVDPGWNR